MGYATQTSSTSIDPGPTLTGQIGEYTSETESAVIALHSGLDRLADRLAATLLAPTPATGGGSTPPKPMASPFGERLRAQAIGVQNAVARVEELLNRLDL